MLLSHRDRSSVVSDHHAGKIPVHIAAHRHGFHLVVHRLHTAASHWLLLGSGGWLVLDEIPHLGDYILCAAIGSVPFLNTKVIFLAFLHFGERLCEAEVLLDTFVRLFHLPPFWVVMMELGVECGFSTKKSSTTMQPSSCSIRRTAGLTNFQNSFWSNSGCAIIRVMWSWLSALSKTSLRSMELT